MIRLLLALSLTGLSLPATILTYTDRDFWLQSAGTITNIDFSNLAATGEQLNVSDGLSTRGVRFTPTGSSQLFVVDRDFPGFDFGAPAVLSPQLGFPAGFLAVLPAGTTAVSTNLSGFLGDPTNFFATITTGLGSSTIGFSSSGFPPFGFFGFTSTENILSVAFSSAPADGVFTNFAHNGSEVPEPSTLAMMGTALLLAMVSVKFARR